MFFEACKCFFLMAKTFRCERMSKKFSFLGGDAESCARGGGNAQKIRTQIKANEWKTTQNKTIPMCVQVCMFM